ncbi:LysR family transcriptional regulator [Alloalcanivorax xenomutans]|uniref:LysR family transcriptional regulator n=1 Tax=Alloalcanivorax xenomutans TaxID=1094342 RepID=UPI000BD0ED8A|nr:LysR family transcriptional regulator [Alloalcanivorax xenomutans]SOC28081.1 LysR family transcriptional regulator [Alloalcanivorax xenomutans]
MDKLKAMATFVRIVDSGSLSAAADAQGQSPASVVRSLAALERSLNVRLLNRTTRQLSLTDEGRDYLARCRRILTEVSEAESALQERQKGPSGIVGITAPETFGRYHVGPLVNRFLSDHPAMRVNLVLDDKVVNLVEAGLDLAIRIGHPRDSSLVVRPLGQMSTVVCASPDYLESQGEPVTPQELGHRPCVLFAPQGPLWSFHDQTVRIDPTLVTNQIESARQACIAGLGFGRFYHYQVRDALTDGTLVKVLEAFEPDPIPVLLTYPHSQLLPRRVRYVIDWLAPRLTPRLAA